MTRLYFQNKVLVLLIFTAFSGIRTSAQSISGIVKDAETKQPISFCSLLIIQSNLGTTTDVEGRFQLEIPIKNNTPKLVVSILGYDTDTLTISSGQTEFEIFLNPSQDILNEVIITGVSRTTLIRENPIAISSVSSKVIDKTMEPNIIDALVKNVPGLNAVKTGPNISKPFIRGLGYNRVLTLYDGLRQEGQQWGDEHGIEVDAYNIYKAEVIKGPASLMYGSDAVAGVVSMFPYLPKKKYGTIYGRVLSEYQSNNGLIGNSFRLGYNNGKWLWIVRGGHRIAKNYSNIIDGIVYNTSFRETNAAATIGYKSAKGYTHLNATLYNNLQGIPDGSRDSLTRRFTKQIYDGDLDEINNRPIISNDELRSYNLSSLHQHIQHYRVYANSHYQVGSGEIDATLGFQQNIRREYSHPTMPKQAGLFVRLNTINYGIRYIAPSFSNVEFTFGVNGMYQNNRSKDATDFPIPDYNLLDIGGYIYGKWKQNKLTVSGGVRYDTRFLKSKDFYVGPNSSNGFDKQYFLPDTAGSQLQFPSLKKRFEGISLSIGFTYQLTEQISLKANVARGYRSPNITEIASNGLDPGAHIIYLGNRNFVPEFSFQQDLGITGNFKNFIVSFSIFNNNIDHYIYLTQLADANGNAIVDAQGNKTFQYQQATAQLYGFEASFSWHPNSLKGFSFDNSFSLVYGYNRKKDFQKGGIEGEFLPLIPPAKLLSSMNKEFQLQSKVFTSLNFKAEMEFNAAQNRYLALNNTETATPHYTLFNFSVNTEINFTKNNLLQLQFQLNNAFDVSYQSNLSRLKYFEYYSQSPNGKLGMYNMGRSFGVKAILSF
jgi:iron complex outermembrane receptor protein